MQPILIIVLWMLSLIVAAFVGGFLNSYLKKKGENLATREDIKLLVDQMKAVTQAQKEIEARISGEMWDRQKRWELRRDVLLEIARKIGRETEAMIELSGVYTTEMERQQKGLPPRIEVRSGALKAWNDAAAEFEGMLLLVTASCGDELAKAVYQFGYFMRRISDEVTETGNVAFSAASKEMAERAQAIAVAIRNELHTSGTR